MESRILGSIGNSKYIAFDDATISGCHIIS